MGTENPPTNPPANPPADPPPAPTPPPADKPPVVVNHPGSTELMNAITSLPEKLAETFAEKFPVNPRTPPAPENTPPAPATGQPPATPPATPPKTAAPQQGGTRFANWFFGNKR